MCRFWIRVVAWPAAVPVHSEWLSRSTTSCCQFSTCWPKAVARVSKAFFALVMPMTSASCRVLMSMGYSAAFALRGLTGPGTKVVSKGSGSDPFEAGAFGFRMLLWAFCSACR